jgi:hypothetical protein
MADTRMDGVIGKARTRYLNKIVDGPVEYVLRRTSCRNPRCTTCIDKVTGLRFPAHGPYWYLVAYCAPKGKRWIIYIGKRMDTSKWRTPDGGVDWNAYFGERIRAKAKKQTKTTYEEAEQAAQAFTEKNAGTNSQPAALATDDNPF